jgi:hypothetical protein
MLESVLKPDVPKNKFTGVLFTDLLNCILYLYTTEFKILIQLFEFEEIITETKERFKV